MVATAPQGVTVFDRDDAGFFDWLDQNPDGYFLNTARNPAPHAARAESQAESQPAREVVAAGPACPAVR